MADASKQTSPLCTHDQHEQCAGKGCACACHVCTWKGCSRKAAHRQIAQDGDKWANLCEQHNTQLEEAITGGEAKTLLHCWTMAGGGPEKMAARLASGSAGRLADLLKAVGKGDNVQGDSAAPLDANGPEQSTTGHGAIPKGNVHPNNPQSPRRLTAAQRRKQVMEYKLLGAGLQQIADKLGMSKSRVHQIVCEELQKNSEQTRLATEQYRQLHLEQLDAMEMGLMQQARTGDVFAVDRIIRIQTQRASLLAGLAVPTKIAAGVGGLDGDGNPSGGAPVILQLTPDEAKM
jgi:hypothetical protein